MRAAAARDDHRLAVGRPAQDVVVAAEEGELSRLAAFDRHQPDVVVAGAIARERDGSAVRRERRALVATDVARDAPCVRAVRVRDPDVVEERERDGAVVGDGGIAEESDGLGESHGGGGGGGQDDGGSEGEAGGVHRGIVEEGAKLPGFHGWRQITGALRSCVLLLGGGPWMHPVRRATSRGSGSPREPEGVAKFRAFVVPHFWKSARSLRFVSGG